MQWDEAEINGTLIELLLCRCFPSAWQVHFIWPNGRGALLTGIEKARPSYERLLSVLRGVPGSKASRSWVDRVNPFSRVSATAPLALCNLPAHALRLLDEKNECFLQCVPPLPGLSDVKTYGV